MDLNFMCNRLNTSGLRYYMVLFETILNPYNTFHRIDDRPGMWMTKAFDPHSFTK